MTRPEAAYERELFARFSETGDRTVRNELAERHRGLAITLARRFNGRGEPLDDLLPVAMIALLRAIERFEPERGERTVLHLRFYEELSQSEIADRVGLGQMHVSRILRATPRAAEPPARREGRVSEVSARVGAGNRCRGTVLITDPQRDRRTRRRLPIGRAGGGEC